MSIQEQMFELPKSKATEYQRRKRNWENAFQRWSDKQQQDELTEYGACGYGAMCDYCEDVSYGRPCVRALNQMCKETGIVINYYVRDFEEIWRGVRNEHNNQR